MNFHRLYLEASLDLLINNSAWRHYFSIITMATFDTKTPTYGYGYLILSLDSLISCLFFVFIAKVLSAYAHGIGPMVCTIGIWIALRLMGSVGVEAIDICQDMENGITMISAFPGRLAILCMASQVYDFLAIVILDYAPLVEDYKIYGMACWFALKGVVWLGIAIYKICKDNQLSKKNVYEQLV